MVELYDWARTIGLDIVAVGRGSMYTEESRLGTPDDVFERFGLRMLYKGAVKEKETASWSNFQRHLTPSGMAMTRRIFQRSLADLEANYWSIERMLPDIQSRTLVLWGDGDPFFSTGVGERTRAAIPDAELIVFEETGLFVPEERPADVAVAIREFLQS